jgi:2-oxoglutarate ferredoxin oxidoreductase subunit alpha
VLVPELNLGQFAKLLKSQYLVDVIQFNKVQGLPFKVAELQNRMVEILGGPNGK